MPTVRRARPGRCVLLQVAVVLAYLLVCGLLLGGGWAPLLVAALGGGVAALTHRWSSA